MAGLNNVECAFVERIDKSMLLGNSSMFRKDNTLYEMSYEVGFYGGFSPLSGGSTTLMPWAFLQI